MFHKRWTHSASFDWRLAECRKEHTCNMYQLSHFGLALAFPEPQLSFWLPIPVEKSCCEDKKIDKVFINKIASLVPGT